MRLKLADHASTIGGQESVLSRVRSILLQESDTDKKMKRCNVVDKKQSLQMFLQMLLNS